MPLPDAERMYGEGKGGAGAVARGGGGVGARVAVTALDWHPKRSVMATVGADGNVRVWVPPGESERYARA